MTEKVEGQDVPFKRMSNPQKTELQPLPPPHKSDKTAVQTEIPIVPKPPSGPMTRTYSIDTNIIPKTYTLKLSTYKGDTMLPVDYYGAKNSEQIPLFRRDKIEKLEFEKFEKAFDFIETYKSRKGGIFGLGSVSNSYEKYGNEININITEELNKYNYTLDNFYDMLCGNCPLCFPDENTFGIFMDSIVGQINKSKPNKPYYIVLSGCYTNITELANKDDDNLIINILDDISGSKVVLPNTIEERVGLVVKYPKPTIEFKEAVTIDIKNNPFTSFIFKVEDNNFVNIAKSECNFEENSLMNCVIISGSKIILKKRNNKYYLPVDIPKTVPSILRAGITLKQVNFGNKEEKKYYIGVSGTKGYSVYKLGTEIENVKGYELKVLRLKELDKIRNYWEKLSFATKNILLDKTLQKYFSETIKTP